MYDNKDIKKISTPFMACILPLNITNLPVDTFYPWRPATKMSANIGHWKDSVIVNPII